MSYVRILIHAVWGTKNRDFLIPFELRDVILNHIRENAHSKKIHIDSINSQPDHVRCLMFLNADLSMAKTMNLIKGESSFWINKQKLLKYHFEWANEYYAASVSESAIPKVRSYIHNQDEHHRKINFKEEYERFLLEYGSKSMG